GTPRSAQLLAAPASAVHVPFLEGRPFAEVLKKARAESKPIMLDVVAEWCGPCKLMDRTTFSDPAVVEWAKKSVVPTRFDAEKGEGRKLASRYAVRSFPTVLFLDGKGNEIDRLLGAHPPEDFRLYGGQIVTGKSRLAEGLAKLKKEWNPETAVAYATSLAQRNDLARVRPLALRIVGDDPDLTHGETLDTFFLLVALEDYNEKVSPETTDLISTYLPRIPASDQRAGMMAVVLARELGRRGDVAEARKAVAMGLKLTGESSLLAVDLLSAQGTAERKAGQNEAAVATFRRAAQLAESLNAAPTARASRQLDLAEALAAAGKATEARAALATGLERAGNAATALARASRIALLLKSPDEAVTYARRA
ncbi:MAG: thioredoxin family protein, partial [Legionella sp.]